MTDNSRERLRTHYEVLGLVNYLHGPISKDVVKAAYRKALLQHHPDKGFSQHPRVNRSLSLLSHSGTPPTYTIDDISLAYKVLADPIARADYNRQLDLQTTSGQIARSKKESVIHAGIETFDLEELDYNEKSSTWHRPCRCGTAQGYRVSECQLEQEAGHGEVYVGCEGCSLWIRVLFEIEESAEG